MYLAAEITGTASSTLQVDKTPPVWFQKLKFVLHTSQQGQGINGEFLSAL